MVQVSDGGLGEVSNILTRLRVLGVQAASDTVGEKERGFIDLEVQQLKNEVQRISQTTPISATSNCWDGSGGKFDFQVDINNDSFNDPGISFSMPVNKTLKLANLVSTDSTVYTRTKMVHAMHLRN